MYRCQAQDFHQVQLIEKNRQTVLADEPVEVVLELDTTQIQSQKLHSDKRGIVDLTAFRRTHQKQFDAYGKRARWVLWCQTIRTDLTKTQSNKAGIFKLQLDLGPIMVSGNFVDENGARITHAREVFSAELRPYLSESNLSWHSQCRLYQTDKNGRPDEMISNGIRFNEDGSFRFYVAKNHSYRFDWLGIRDLILLNPTFAVAEADVELKLVIKPKPYCLYGNFLEAATGNAVTEWIKINGFDVSFFGIGKPGYALFFDKPTNVKLEIASLLFQKKYREQEIEIDVREPLQRHDFKLELLEGNAATIQFQLKFNGPPMGEYSGVGAYLSGEKYFSQRGEYRGENTFEFTLPQAGEYNLDLYSPQFTFEAPASILIENEQTFEIKSIAKDTWLTVRLVDENNQAIGFPERQDFTTHASRVNCVLLEEIDTVQKRAGSRGPYLNFGVADIGGALRPDDKGGVKFLLSRGGKFALRTSFEGFEDSRTPIEVPSHESKAVTLQLQSRR